MDRLRCLEIFAEAARRGSFTAAAGHSGMSRAVVSKHVASLERSLGAPLPARTPQRVGLTDAGRRALQNALLLIERREEMENDVCDLMSTPRGLVRVGTPPSFGVRHLVPPVAVFAERHLDIQVALGPDDGRASPVADRHDLSARIAPALEDASFVAQTPVQAPQALVSSPAYLQRAGTPATLDDLPRHECLIHPLNAPTARWHLQQRAPAAPATVAAPSRR